MSIPKVVMLTQEELSQLCDLCDDWEHDNPGPHIDIEDQELASRIKSVNEKLKEVMRME